MDIKKLNEELTKLLEAVAVEEGYGIDVSGDEVEFRIKLWHDNVYDLIYNGNRNWHIEIPFGGDKEDLEYGIRELLDEFMLYEWEDEKGVKSYDIKTLVTPEEGKDGLLVISLKTIINEYEPYAKTVNKDTNEDGELCYSVLVADKNSDWEAWVDICGENCEWNQYMFSTNNTKDILTKYLQENPKITEMAMEVAQEVVLKN